MAITNLLAVLGEPMAMQQMGTPCLMARLIGQLKSGSCSSSRVLAAGV